jgi:hypothetical protein
MSSDNARSSFKNFAIFFRPSLQGMITPYRMRPYALLEDSPESLAEHEVCRGRLYKAGESGYTRKSFDILASFLGVLGKPAGQVPAN